MPSQDRAHSHLKKIRRFVIINAGVVVIVRYRIYCRPSVCMSWCNRPFRLRECIDLEGVDYLAFHERAAGNNIGLSNQCVTPVNERPCLRISPVASLALTSAAVPS